MDRHHRSWGVLVAVALQGCMISPSEPRIASQAPLPPPPPPAPQPVARALPAPISPTPEPVYSEPIRPTPASRPRDWTKLGETRVDGRGDRDVIAVDSWDDRYRTLRVRVDDSRLRMHDLEVELADGTTFKPDVPRVLEPGEAITIDLPGRSRRVKAIHFRYTDLRGGGRAHVEVWGQ